MELHNKGGSTQGRDKRERLEGKKVCVCVWKEKRERKGKVGRREGVFVCVCMEG